MKKAIGVIGVTGLLWIPLSALAQEDGGGTDTGVHPDSAVHDSLVPDAGAHDSFTRDNVAGDTLITDRVAHDSFVPDAAVGCGTVTYFGECSGSVVHYCMEDQLRTVDCVDRYGANATCGLLDCTNPAPADCQGYWCVPTTGSSCTGELTACDVAAQEGCLGGLCAASSTCDPTSFQPTCSGTVITSCGYTINNRDCAAEGRPFTCGAASGGRNACLGGQGAACDPVQGAECQAPLSCVRGVCGTVQSDAGQQPLDAGNKPDAATSGGEEDTCNCQTTSAGSAALALLALCGVALIRRRR